MTTNGSPYLPIMDSEESAATQSASNEAAAAMRYRRQQQEAGPSSQPMMTGDEGKGKRQKRTVSRSNKAIAAISGAIATSLTMTPFDVIKTRMQTQREPGPLFQPTSSSSSLSSAARAAATSANVSCCQPTFLNEQNVACRYDPRTEAQMGTSNATPARGPHQTATHGLRHAGKHLTSGASSAVRPRATPLASFPINGNNISAAACIYPDKTFAVHDLERIRSEGRLSGLWDGVVKVGRHEGVRGLWRGLTPTLAMTIPSQVTYMTCYDVLRTALLGMGEAPAASQKPSLSNVSSHTMATSLVAGALARGASATLVTPLELLRTRLQASDSSNLTSLIKDLAREMKHESPAVLWRGLVPTLYRDVPFSGLYFAGYETLKRILTGSGLGERHIVTDRPAATYPNNQQHRDFAVAFVSGATSGVFAAIVTQPFDLVKTRLQAAEEQGRKNAVVPSKMGAALREIIEREGYRGLFRGLSPRVAKVAPACGIMIASFELVAVWLDQRDANAASD